MHIDAGVDTGGIITKKTIVINKGDSITDLEKKAELLAGELMAETVCSYIEGKRIRVTTQKQDNGKQYYRMSKNIRRQVEKILKQNDSGKIHGKPFNETVNRLSTFFENL